MITNWYSDFPAMSAYHLDCLNTVESSTFGLEFNAMKTTIDQIKALCYKLWMMGVPWDGEMNIFCENESVFKNSPLPESTLKKKHNSIAYHHTCEAQAMNVVGEEQNKSHGSSDQSAAT